MSSVRMCDNCRTVFSENDPGWQRGVVRNMAQVGGETVIQEQSEDRCPSCAVGAVAQGNAQRVYQPELPAAMRGMDPRVRSALAQLASAPEAVRKALGELVPEDGRANMGVPAQLPTPVDPLPVPAQGPDRLPGSVSPVVPALEDGKQG